MAKYTLCIPSKSCFVAIFAYRGEGRGEINSPPTGADVLTLFTFTGRVTKVLGFFYRTSGYNSPPAKRLTNPTQVKHLF